MFKTVPLPNRRTIFLSLRLPSDNNPFPRRKKKRKREKIKRIIEGNANAMTKRVLNPLSSYRIYSPK